MKSRLIFRRVLSVTLLAIALSNGIGAQSNDRYVKGIVQSSSGRVFSSVWVIVSQNGREQGRSLTGDDGRYYISNLSDGGYELAVYRGSGLIYKGQVNLTAYSRRHDIVIR